MVEYIVQLNLPATVPLVNSMYTDWLSTPFAVKQGDILSPTLFTTYVNDLPFGLIRLLQDVLIGL